MSSESSVRWCGELGAELLSHWNNDVEEVRRLFDDGYYLGAFDSVADYTQEITEETVEIPEPLRFYVDYASMARDRELNGDIFTVELDGQRWVQNGHSGGFPVCSEAKMGRPP